MDTGKSYFKRFEAEFNYIKAEISHEKEYAYADFERYKVEFLGQDWEDVLESLPKDDYRYGMERCLEIINKHIRGNEQELSRFGTVEKIGFLPKNTINLYSTPLEEVLEDIKMEIEKQVFETLSDGGDDWFTADKVSECIDIIDGYISGKEKK